MKPFILYIVLLFCFVSARGQNELIRDDNGSLFTEEFVHEASELYNWEEIEIKFAAEVDIIKPKAHDFFSYAFRSGLLSMNEYLTGVKNGTITSANAQQYWLDKTSEFKVLYSEKYIPYMQWLLSPATKKGGNNSVLTGGPDCNNLDFTDGTNGWGGQYNIMSGPAGAGNYGGLTATGLNSSSSDNNMFYTHEMCTPGNDPNVPLDRVPPGHTTSLRLGSDSACKIVAGNFAIYPYNHQVISNTFLVTNANKAISYWYAVALSQNSTTAHAQQDQPYFKIRMYDAAGNEIQCARYDIDATTASQIGGFDVVPNVGNSDFYYKDWSQVMIPLSNYVGQNVTITFETSDCAHGGHFGYAYIAVDCAPLPKITVSPIPCVGGNGTLVAPGGAGSYTWTGPGIVGSNTTQTINVNAGGTYSVTMTTLGNSGFTCSFGADTVIAPPPTPIIAAFNTVNIPCSGNPVQFSDQTNANGGTLNAWQWDFGDGTQSSANNPTHTYATGTYVVNYTVTTTAGCTDSHSTSIIVSQSPTPAFTNNTVCIGGTTAYTNTTAGAISYSWNFGDGSAAAINTNPTHIYASTGTFQTILTATSNEGCISTLSQPAIVNAFPTAAFTNTLPCLGVPINFTNTSSILTGTYNWTFGSAPNTSTIQNPIHQYNSAGTYTVTLAIDGGNNCIANTSSVIVISPTPTITIASPAPFCPGDVVPAAPIVSNPSTGIVYSWTNNNTQTGLAATGTGIPASFSAASNNSGVVVSSVVSVTPYLSGCPGAPASYTLQVKPTPALLPPVVNFCPDEISPVINLSSTPVSGSTIYSWTNSNPGTNIGLSASSGGSSIPSFTTVNATLNPLTIIISTSVSLNGCVGAPVAFPITVHPSPIADFSHTRACVGNQTDFSDQSILTSGSIISWGWDLDGNGSYTDATGANTTTTFAPVGFHPVGLEVISDKGCRDSYAEVIYVNNTPQVDLSGDVLDGCTTHEVTFTSSASIPSPENIVSYSWSFGNGTGSLSQGNPTVSYENGSHTENELFTVTLEVTSDSGCVGKVTKIDYITVFPQPLADFTWNPTDADIIDPTISFINLAVGVSGTQPIYWYLGDHSLVNNSDNYTAVTSPIHIYPYIASSYNVTQWVSNEHGCRDSVTKTILIDDAFTFYIPNAFSPHLSNRVNDGFKGTGIGIDNASYSLLVFDRWGNKVFESHDLEEEWDGKYMGKLVQTDVYVWKADFNDTKGFPHQYSGTVTVVR